MGSMGLKTGLNGQIRRLRMCKRLSSDWGLEQKGSCARC